MIKLFSKLQLVPLLFLVLSSIAQQKNANADLIAKQMIRSSVLRESRELLVYTPVNVSTKLSLILVFDGGGFFDAAVSAARFMNYYSEIPQMPEAVIIGIQNTDRNRDMPIPQQYGGEKREDNFLKFVKDELIPWADKKYLLNGHVIIVGHSQGGLFVSYLLSKYPEQFPWILALDAPMNVEPKINPVKEMIAKAVKDNNKIRYASIETTYGWKEEWAKYFSEDDRVMRKEISDETHESMAFKGVYEGFKFLYKDFAPVRKDMSLTELRNYYQVISGKYGYDYEIPLRVLMASALRKIPENRKTDILALLDHAELKYGSSDMIKELRTRSSALTNATRSIVDSFLALPAPSLQQVDKYIGTWTGQFISKEGKSFSSTIEISIKDGKPKLLTSFDPNNPEKKQEPEVLHVTKEGKLVFGIRNRGGGIIVNILDLNNKAELVGEGRWLGFTIPQDVPAEQRKQLNFLLTTPTKYFLTRN